MIGQRFQLDPTVSCLLEGRPFAQGAFRAAFKCTSQQTTGVISSQSTYVLKQHLLVSYGLPEGVDASLFEPEVLRDKRGALSLKVQTFT